MKITIAQFFVLGCLALGPTCVIAAPTLTVEPSLVSVSTGSNFSVIIDINTVNDLYAYQLDVDFNPKILSVSAVTEKSFLPGGGGTFFLPGTIDNVGGSITSIADTLLGSGGGVSGKGALVQIDFAAKGSGMSSIDLANFLFLDSTGGAIGLSTRNGSVDVSPALASPEPRFAWLIALFLISLKPSSRRARMSLGGCKNK
jgi:general secretion pathway protein D